MTLSGKCRCNAVSYTLNTDTPLVVYACHCKDCQTWSSSAFALHALAPVNTISVDGPLSEYVHDANGHTSQQHLCSQCHTRLYNTTSAAPGMLVLRAGTLDNSPFLHPAAHIWTSRKQHWLALPEGVASWAQSPTPQQFAEALRDRG